MSQVYAEIDFEAARKIMEEPPYPLVITLAIFP